MLLFWFIQECGPLSSRAYYIFAQQTHSNVLEKLGIRDLIEQLGDSKITVDRFGKNTILAKYNIFTIMLLF